MVLAAIMGYWAYSDAKKLQLRGVTVGRFSPVTWGICVALVAILFGVLYLMQRSRALRAVTSPSFPPEPWTDPPPRPPTFSEPRADRPDRDHVCRNCGHELPAYAVSFCPKCGTQL